MENTVTDVLEKETEKTEEFTTESAKGIERYTFQYILSFIVPLIGYILGALLLTRNEETERKRGIICLLAGILSTVVFTVISRL